MNAFAGCLKQEKFLSSKEGMEKLFSALEAERPENMQEVVEIAMRLELYEFLPEKIVTAEDYGEYLLEEAQIVLDEKIAPFIDIEGYGFSQMEKNGIVQTEHGLIFRKDKPIQMLPKEFEGIRLFSPLTALMYGQEGYESDEPEGNHANAAVQVCQCDQKAAHKRAAGYRRRPWVSGIYKKPDS